MFFLCNKVAINIFIRLIYSLTSPSLCDLVQLSTRLSQKPSGRTTITETAVDPARFVDSLIQDLATRHAPRRASTIKAKPFPFVSSLINLKKKRYYLYVYIN